MKNIELKNSPEFLISQYEAEKKKQAENQVLN